MLSACDAFQRLAARVVTGPIAFLVAGVIDIAAFAFAMLRARIRIVANSRGPNTERE